MGVRADSGRQARRTLERLRRAHPDARCSLYHSSPFQLLVATVLSAQSTDVAVNQILPALFGRWPDPEAFTRARPAAVEKALGRIGMYRQKARHVIGLSRRLVAEHDSRVPDTLESLVELPGVGRKTANVVLGVAFGRSQGVVVDTHVQRLAQRLGWSGNSAPLAIEQDLMRLFPQKLWDTLSHTLIFHGRRICRAVRPACAACAVSDVCPSAFRAERVGRKAARVRPRAATQRERARRG
ncbi:MAG: endonuclease III [Polyangiaceae bacterium]|nr:endonuclease III [Polyangiaceae bacterium]